MILPGHIAASYLCHRHLSAELTPALLAGVAPDVIDKAAHYLLRASPSSRLPMHTLLGWFASTLLVALIAWLLARARGHHGLSRRWAWAWFAGYGAHLLCDSPLVGQDLPLLWPWRAYAYSSTGVPLGYLFDGGPLPWWTLLAETLLVLYTLTAAPPVKAWLLRRRARA